MENRSSFLLVLVLLFRLGFFLYFSILILIVYLVVLYCIDLKYFFFNPVYIRIVCFFQFKASNLRNKTER